MKRRIKIIEQVELGKELKRVTDFPWPWETGSVGTMLVTGVLEFVPGRLRGRFMDELYRVMCATGKATVVIPYWSTLLGTADYLYEWPPLSEASFMYFNREWREKNALLHRGLTCDFDFSWGYQLEGEVANRPDESRSFYLKYYTNAVQRLTLTLTKAKHEGKK